MQTTYTMVQMQHPDGAANDADVKREKVYMGLTAHEGDNPISWMELAGMFHKFLIACGYVLPEGDFQFVPKKKPRKHRLL